MARFTGKPLIAIGGSIALNDPDPVYAAMAKIRTKHRSVTFAYMRRPAGVSTMVERWLTDHACAGVSIPESENAPHILASISGLSGAVIFPGDPVTLALSAALQARNIPIWYPKGSQ